MAGTEDNPFDSVDKTSPDEAPLSGTVLTIDEEYSHERFLRTQPRLTIDDSFEELAWLASEGETYARALMLIRLLRRYARFLPRKYANEEPNWSVFEHTDGGEHFAVPVSLRPVIHRNIVEFVDTLYAVVRPPANDASAGKLARRGLLMVVAEEALEPRRIEILEAAVAAGAGKAHDALLLRLVRMWVHKKPGTKKSHTGDKSKWKLMAEWAEKQHGVVAHPRQWRRDWSELSTEK